MTDIYYDGGNLALGTSDAENKQLHVAGLARFTADGPGRVESIEVLNGNATKNDEASIMFLGRTDGLVPYRLGSIGGLVEDNANAVRRGALVFRTSNNEIMNEVMRLTSRGDIGIGITDPNFMAEISGRRLTIAGDGALPQSDGRIELVNTRDPASAGDDIGKIFFVARNDAPSVAQPEKRGAAITGSLEGTGGPEGFGGKLRFWTKADGSKSLEERLTISSDGKVGIGDTTPDRTLDVAGDASVSADLFVGGQIGLGVVLPTYGLEIAGCSNNQCAYKPDGENWTTSSDARLKKNIVPLSDAMSRLLRLRGVSYEWIDPEKHGNLAGPQTGMIAQEVEEVFPDWVGTDKDGFKTLTIRGFEALAVESFRELKTENDALRRQVSDLSERAERTAKLEADLAAERAAREKLEARLAAIEARLSATSPATKPAASGPAKASSRIGF